MLKLNPARGLEYEVHEMRQMDFGPERMLVLVDLLRRDLERFPLDVAPPAAVRKAREGFEAACSWAAGIADGIAASEEAAKTAQAADVEATADAMRDAKERPDLSQFAAGQDVTGAFVDVQAAERLVEEAHERLVDAANKAWPKWRKALIAAAGDAHAAASVAMAEAVAAVAGAQASYSAVSALDAEMTNRVPEAKAARDREYRGAFNWFDLTHNMRKPLKHVALPGQHMKGKPVTVDLASMLQACAAVVSRTVDFAPSDWSPPGDEDHAERLEEPLDLTAPWVIFAVAQAQGGRTCALCRRRDGDTVVEEGGKLKLMCARCANAPLDPKVKAREERQARVRRGDYSDEPVPSYRIETE